MQIRNIGKRGPTDHVRLISTTEAEAHYYPARPGSGEHFTLKAKDAIINISRREFDLLVEAMKEPVL